MDDGEIQIGPWLVQPRLNSITSGGSVRRLEPKVMQVLVHLAARPGEVVSKEELIREVWPNTFVSDDALLRCISELRKAFDDDPKHPRSIQTISKRGYRLIAQLGPAGSGTPEAEQHRRRGLSRRRALAGALALAALAAGGSLAWLRFWSGSPERRLMLAVLPFENLSGDPEQEYFSDGLTEEMITQLARLQPERLGVIARTSAMHYKGSDRKLDEIGRELGVHYVLEGSVRREGGRARITAQLIRVSDQSHLWAESYDRDVGALLAVQAEVARAVAGRIRLTLGVAKRTELARARPVNPEALAAYLMGNFRRHKLTPEDLETAIKHFHRAIELDPGYARAWLGLSDSHRMLGSWWGDVPPRKAFPLAKQELHRALELDSTLGEAHGSLGWIYFVYDWDPVKAEAEFKRGIELSPNSRDTHSPYANFLRHCGRYLEARRQLDRCLEIDPLAPLELTEAALLYLETGDIARAGQLASRVMTIAPESRPAIWTQAIVFMNTGKLDKAIELLEPAAHARRPDRLSLGYLGVVYARAGRHQDARRVLDRLLATPQVDQVSVSRIYRYLGDNEQAIRWLEKGFEERSPQMVGLWRATASHPLWPEPRFRDLVRKMNSPLRPGPPF